MYIFSLTKELWSANKKKYSRDLDLLNKKLYFNLKMKIYVCNFSLCSYGKIIDLYSYTIIACYAKHAFNILSFHDFLEFELF